MKGYIPFFLLFLAVSSFISCEEEDMKPTYEIPNTYNFDNVSYTGQTDRLGMMLEMKSYMATSRESGVTLDAARLKAMFANDATNAGFSREFTKQIKSKTFETEQVIFENLMEELATASQSTVAGSEGVAGVIVSEDGEKSYLVGADGLDHAQVIEKGLMGACFYYQTTSVYMGADRMNVDNETVEEGKGTTMEHHWDEAWGYFGAPIDFPTNTDGLFFWADYSNQRNAILESNQPLMDAFLKGRAAISNKDLEARDEAIATTRENLELIAVGSALHYLNDAIAGFGDMSRFSHSLSEAIGFTYALTFNEAKKISITQVDELLTLEGGAADFADMNLYQVSVADLEEAKAKLAEWYNLKDKADEF